MGLFCQILFTVIAQYVNLTSGIMFAWPSSTYSLFGSAETTLDRPMTEYELALLGSLSSIGALVSTPLTGYGMHVLGRKYTNLLLASTYAISWTLIALFNKVEVILVSVFISGLGGAVLLVVPVFVAEICQESIRGTMTASGIVSYGIGLLLSYLLGGTLEYHLMVYICLGIAFFGVIILLFVRESPTFLMYKGRDEEAAKSIAFYRNVKPSSDLVLEVMEKIRQSLNPALDDIDGATPGLMETVKPEPTEKSKPEKHLSQWQFIKKSRSTRQALVMCFAIATATILQGFLVVQVYAVPIFEEAVPNMSTTTSSVLLAVVSLVAALITGYLSDVSGRRALMIYGSGTAGLCCVLLGTQLHLNWGPQVMTAVFIYLYCIAYTFGAGTVPLILSAEVFLPEVRSLLSMLVCEWAWLCNFVMLFMFNPLVARVGLGPVFYFFATVCFVTAVFCAKYQPETKGLTVNEIQSLFSKKRALFSCES